MIRLGVDLGVFRDLSKANGSLTVSQLASVHDASPTFMGMLMTNILKVLYLTLERPIADLSNRKSSSLSSLYQYDCGGWY